MIQTQILYIFGITGFCWSLSQLLLGGSLTISYLFRLFTTRSKNTLNKECNADALLILVQVELLSGGVNVPVTPLNVYEYVRKYAEHRMLVVAEQPLHVSKTQNLDSLLAMHARQQGRSTAFSHSTFTWFFVW